MPSQPWSYTVASRTALESVSDSPRASASNGERLFYIHGGRIEETLLNGQEERGMVLLGFGQDAADELYVLANQTGVPLGETGVVMLRSQVTSFRADHARLAVPRALFSSGGAAQFYSVELPGSAARWRRLAAGCVAVWLSRARPIGAGSRPPGDAASASPCAGGR